MKNPIVFWLRKLITSLKQNGVRATWERVKRKLLSRRITRRHREAQDCFFPEIEAEAAAFDSIMTFFLPPTDIVSGGLMSISYLADRSLQLKELHGYHVVSSTVPGKNTISSFSEFASPLQIIRFEQLLTLIRDKRRLFVQIPEMCVEGFLDSLLHDCGWLGGFEQKRINILNQNTELMPSPETVKKLAGFFDCATQTCAHAKYCTPEMARLYQMPLHQLPADYPIQYYHLPFSEKENIIAYSNDVHPLKEAVLKRLGELIPDYKLVLIDHLPFDGYKRLISRAKWTLSFGEGWDGYFLQPYSSESVGLCVYNEAFCPAAMRELPTVFPDYETLPERLCRFIMENDDEEHYAQIISAVKNTLFPPCETSAPEPLAEYYRGNYTIKEG